MKLYLTFSLLIIFCQFIGFSQSLYLSNFYYGINLDENENNNKMIYSAIEKLRESIIYIIINCNKILICLIKTFPNSI
jgi:hypothetical protein